MSHSIAQFVIDPSGQVWDADQLVRQQATSQIPIVTTATALTDDLVASKGFASLRTSDAACQVLFNPRMIRQATYDALFDAIAVQNSRLIIIGSYQDRWHFSVHASRVDGLAQIAADRNQAQRPDRMRARDVSPTALARSDCKPLQDAIDLIKAYDFEISSEFLVKLAPLVNQRFMVCSWQPEGHVWRMEHGGSGFGASRYLNVTRHETVGNQPSFEYGCWLHDRYCEVMLSGLPSVEDIDAVVTTEDAGRRRMRYRRLLAPLSDAHGNQLVLTTSVRDWSIDLGSDATGV